MQAYDPSYDFGLLGDPTESFWGDNELVLDSESRSLSEFSEAFSSEASSPDSGFASPECGSPYEDLFIPPTNLGSVTIAVQPEFGQVQSVLHHPDAQIQPYVADSQASNTTSPGWVSGNPFVNDSEARGEKRKRERGYELSAILPRDVLLKISSKDYEDAIKSIERLRPLTQAEQIEVQRQRKKVRNREYAQNCRSKKRQLLESAQDTNERLAQEKNELHNALLEVQRDNQRLVYENTQMKFLLSSLGYNFNSTCMAPPAALQMPQPGSFINANPNMMGALNVGVTPMHVVNTAQLQSAPQTSAPGMTTINIGAATDNTTFFPLNYNTQFTSSSPTPTVGVKMGTDEKKADYNSSFSPQHPFTTICLFAIIFSFGFFFGGSLSTIPGLNTEKIVIESRGRSLFESDAPTQTEPPQPTDPALSPPELTKAPDLKPNCTDVPPGTPCEPPKAEDDGVKDL